MFGTRAKICHNLLIGPMMARTITDNQTAEPWHVNCWAGQAIFVRCSWYTKVEEGEGPQNIVYLVTWYIVLY